MLIDRFLDWLGRRIARRLNRESSGYEPYTPSDPAILASILQPGDVLLVEGNQKISAAIKYLSQSTWSHAAMYVGPRLAAGEPDGEPHVLVEVNLGEGCASSPLSRYATYNTRICRPIGLTREDRETVVDFMVSRIGLQYDMRNILDLARYLFPTPPVPTRLRRRLISMGSGDPTRTICSSLIAQAFQYVNYPILPRIERFDEKRIKVKSQYSRREILHIRHHSLYVPRDFDISPYFAIVKPTIEAGFDYRHIIWAHHDEGVKLLEAKKAYEAEDALALEEAEDEPKHILDERFRQDF